MNTSPVLVKLQMSPGKVTACLHSHHLLIGGWEMFYFILCLLHPLICNTRLVVNPQELQVAMVGDFDLFKGWLEDGVMNAV